MAIGVVGHDGVVLAPRQQRVEHGNERPAGFGEPVLVRAGALWYGARATTPALSRALSRAAMRSRGAPVPAHDVAEVGGPERDLADDEQRPAFADELQRRGDRAGRPGSSASTH